MKKENENISWSLLAKDASGELSPQEHEDLQKELIANPDIEKQVKELWGETHYAQELKTIDADAAWKNVKAQFSSSIKKEKIFKLKRYIAVAAMFAIIMASAFFLRNYLNQATFTTISTTDVVESVMLPDGTKVDLNLGSTLTYPNNFDGDIRQVRLVGEAFFNVVRNVAMPFVIETENLNVKVLGTSFNVKAYANAESAKVTVSTGMVSVVAKTTLHNVILEAGDAVAYTKSINSLEKVKVSTSNYKAWKTKEIEFDNTCLSEVFKTIEDVYHITIEVDSGVDVDKEVLNATFSHHSLKHVLESVCASFNLKFQKLDEKYLITDHS